MIKNIREYLQSHRVLRALMGNGLQSLNNSDPRAIGLLLGSLQFAGGWYLFVPFARFMPPFSKLFEACPAWAWAIYFIVSGIAGMASPILPDGVRYLYSRFLISVWMFFNWFFLTITSALTAVWVLNGKADVNYGIALAFFPCLALASAWKVLRVRQMLADETAEALEQENHVKELKKAADARDKRIKATAALVEI